jgi:hypothetical protein
MQLVFKSTMTQRLPNCKIIALTVTTPVSSEVIRLIGTRYGSCLRILKLTHLNTTRETQLNEDSLLPLRSLTKLRQLSLAWKASATMGPKAFSFLSSLTKLRKLSLEIYEKENGTRNVRTYDHSLLPLFCYIIPPHDRHDHSNNCTHCPYAVITPLARIAPVSMSASMSPRQSPAVSLNSSTTSSPGHTPSTSTTIYLQHPQAAHGTVTSPSHSPLISPTSSPSSFTTANGPLSASPSTATMSTFATYAASEGRSLGELPLRATSAGLPHSPVDPSAKRAKMIQSSPAHHVKPVQTISTAGTNNPSPISILKILSDLTELEEVKLSNWRDFGPLFVLASLAKITTLTIKGRPNDLMTDGASVADASRHFLFLATLQALRSLTLAWIPPCLPQLTRLSNLDLSQAPNLDNVCVAEFSRGLVNLTSLSLDGLASGGLITNIGVAHLVRLTNLTSLDLSNHHQITDEAFSIPNWPLVDLRLNHTSVASLKHFSRFAPTLLHLHVHSCELLPVDNVVQNLRFIPQLITFRFINGALSTMGGIDESLLVGYLDSHNIVCLCDRVIASNRAVSILPGLSSLQYLELYADTHIARLNEAFEPLGYMTSLQSLVLTGIPLTSSLIGYLSVIPGLISVSATKIDETTSSTAKAIIKLSSLKHLSIQLSSSAASDVWIKYVVRLPDLQYYTDGLQHPGDLPWATRRRLYLEWHPRAFKMSRTNNCTIS